ncbi:ABC transporter permease [Reinekea marinisedimentorum]|uniref:Putative spermidine/putrescine transport system permease protein n=1 Tax=Reinekea marinisedimentorum TaxID=230495 RepID=A0A4R3HZG6_9GAMM|nr:ABC transporter permease [Reinekea marinisedimentorum]TCS38797.1 putative spermidine/putrescine transport system permease protein [Reinekea marinisedimentorum]
MKKSKVLTIFVCLVFFYLLFPLFITVVASFNSKDILTYPIDGFSLKWYKSAFSSSYISGFAISFQVGVVATIISLCFGVPVAYGLAKYKSKFTRAIKNVFFSPVLIPGIVLSYSLFLGWVFIAKEFDTRLPKLLVLMLAHIIVLFPYTIRVIGGAFEKFDFTIEDAAESLGATKKDFILHILLPSITPAIISASVLSFITSFNDIPISIFLYGRGSTPLPIIMMQDVEKYGDPSVAAVSVVLLFMTIGITYLIEKTLGLNNYGR